jgi:hypothetical protein
MRGASLTEPRAIGTVAGAGRDAHPGIVTGVRTRFWRTDMHIFAGEVPAELAGCGTEMTLGPAGGDGIGFGRVTMNTSQLRYFYLAGHSALGL